MLTVSDVQALIVITLGDAFVLNRRVRQQTTPATTDSRSIPSLRLGSASPAVPEDIPRSSSTVFGRISWDRL
jgi:hypothetical protein